MKTKIGQILTSFLIILSSSCSQNETETPPPTISTTYVDGVFHVEIINNSDDTIIAKGLCWSTSPTPTLSDESIQNGAGEGSFTLSLTTLSAGTNYFLRAYVTNSLGTTYGNEINFNTPNLAIGELHEGGIIAYILQQDDTGYDANTIHGLIVAPNDQQKSNADNAVATCANLSLGGYTDWYLPSLAELSLLYENREAIAAAGGAFDRNSDAYWSTNSGGGDRTFVMSMTIGRQISDLKEAFYHVRAVRNF